MYIIQFCLVVKDHFLSTETNYFIILTGRAFESRQIKKINNQLQKLGIPLDKNIKHFLSQIISTSGGMRIPNWLAQIFPKRTMDDHILIGGISELDFPFGTVTSQVIINEQICALAWSSENDISTRISVL